MGDSKREKKYWIKKVEALNSNCLQLLLLKHPFLRYVLAPYQYIAHNPYYTTNQRQVQQKIMQRSKDECNKKFLQIPESPKAKHDDYLDSILWTNDTQSNDWEPTAENFAGAHRLDATAYSSPTNFIQESAATHRVTIWRMIERENGPKVQRMSQPWLQNHTTIPTFPSSTSPVVLFSSTLTTISGIRLWSW